MAPVLRERGNRKHEIESVLSDRTNDMKGCDEKNKQGKEAKDCVYSHSVAGVSDNMSQEALNVYEFFGGDSPQQNRKKKKKRRPRLKQAPHFFEFYPSNSKRDPRKQTKKCLTDQDCVPTGMKTKAEKKVENKENIPVTGSTSDSKEYKKCLTPHIHTKVHFHPNTVTSNENREIVKSYPPIQATGCLSVLQNHHSIEDEVSASVKTDQTMSYLTGEDVESTSTQVEEGEKYLSNQSIHPGVTLRKQKRLHSVTPLQLRVTKFTTDNYFGFDTSDDDNEFFSSAPCFGSSTPFVESKPTRVNIHISRIPLLSSCSASQISRSIEATSVTKSGVEPELTRASSVLAEKDEAAHLFVSKSYTRSCQGVKAKPNRNIKKKKKKENADADAEKWASHISSEFHDIDTFQLCVE